MFTKKDRGTFKYWFAHWGAYQLTALNLGCWKPRFLLHDIKKPWQMLLYRDYKTGQQMHRDHARHHLTYWTNREFDDSAFERLDFLGMVIDWECSRFTKQEAPMNARETLAVMAQNLKDGKYNGWVGCYSIEPYPAQIQEFEKRISNILKDLGL